MLRPHIIGIAGASCSGKTTVSLALTEALGDDATVVTLDSYYYDLSHLPPDKIHAVNLDEPAALEHTLLLQNLRDLAAARATDKPVYDHKTHTRLADALTLEPTPYVIVEGLFALYWADVRALMRTKTFIDVAHDACLERRIDRDRNDRGRTEQEVRQRYEEMVRPMAERHVLPTRAHADIVVDGNDSVDNVVSIILSRLTGPQ